MMLESVPNEIVVVRRNKSWDVEEHKGGVWKIAYADFMTALMAFFLVMWLINVTDDSVRRGVAQYFNPVKLASTAPNRKGLNDPHINGNTNENGTKLFQGKLGGTDHPTDQEELMGDGDQKGHQQKDEEPLEKATGSVVPGSFEQNFPESVLSSDPYAVLDTLAGRIRLAASSEANPDGIGAGLERENGARGGDAYRDPFDPLYWQFQLGRGIEGSDAAGKGLPGTGGRNTGADSLIKQGDTGAKTKNTQSVQEHDVSEKTPADKASTPEQTSFVSLTGQDTKPGNFLKERTESPSRGEDNQVLTHVMRTPGKEDARIEQTVSTAGAEIQKSSTSEMAGKGQQTSSTVIKLTEVLKNADGTVLEKTAGQIKVQKTETGTLISLTDDQNFGMFAIGSAEPRPELVALLERLGGVIAKAPGRIVIKGHTDARPFKNKSYDNWRLSSARAHMALYMLSRGGVSKARFDRVEGYADRNPKMPSDPLAAANRRVEIFLLEGAE